MFFKKNQIVTGKIIKVDLENGILVELTNGVKGTVNLDHIGNIPSDKIKEHFDKFEFYKFKVINTRSNQEGLLYLSYKLCHPYLITNKNKIIATSNNFKNMKKALLIDMEDYKKDRQQ